MAAGPLPNPMGGDGYVAVFVVTDIVPVRVVNSNPLDVRVVNFPGVPPPLPGLRPGAMPPPLPVGATPKAPPGLFSKVGLGSFNMGQFAGMATAAGAVAGGIGLAVAGLEQLKATFIDPILGAAKGGFDRGIARGAGVETLGKTFEVLGVTVGVMLLPAVIQLATEALTLSNIFKDFADSPGGKWMLKMSGAGGVPGTGGASPLTTMLAGREAILQKIDKLPIIGEKFSEVTKNLGIRPDITKTLERDKTNMAKVLQAMLESQGAKASFVGLTDIREQAQLAAMQSPLEREMQNLQIEYLRKFINQTAGDIAETAKNTRPPGGGA
jgi:hypothetical protein